MSITRREFIIESIVLGLFSLNKDVVDAFSKEKSTLGSSKARSLPKFKIQTLTSGPKHHFFGYYGICPWNKSGKYLICLESEFQDRMPAKGEVAAIGLVDAKTGEFKKVSETKAWNLQQGAMLHWNPLNPQTQIIYNDRYGNNIISVILDVNTGKKHILPRAVSAVSHSGKYALSLTYGRLERLRKVVGYSGTIDPNPDNPAPHDDGVFLMDLTTGKSKLVVSIAEVYGRLIKKHPQMKGRHMWFNHTVFNRTDSRFLFLARAYLPPGGKRQTGMFTANLDGSDLREAVPFGKNVSHFDWRNDKEIIATFEIDGSERKHVLFTDGQADYKVIGGGFLDYDGHCTFSPDPNWLATDRKHHDTIEQSLSIYNIRSKQGLVLCKLDLREKKYISGNVRCDFHPRWNRTGDAICFDALDQTNGTRQLHMAYLNFD